MTALSTAQAGRRNSGAPYPHSTVDVTAARSATAISVGKRFCSRDMPNGYTRGGFGRSRGSLCVAERG